MDRVGLYGDAWPTYHRWGWVVCWDGDYKTTNGVGGYVGAGQRITNGVGWYIGMEITKLPMVLNDTLVHDQCTTIVLGQCICTQTRNVNGI